MSSAASSNSNNNDTSMRMLSEIEDYDDDADVDTDVTYDNDDDDDDDDDDDGDDGALTFTPVPSSPAKQRSRRLHGANLLHSISSSNNSDNNTKNMTSDSNGNYGSSSNNNNSSNGSNSDDPPPPPPQFPPPGRYSTMSSLAYSTASGMNDSMILSSLWDSTIAGGSWYFHPNAAAPTSTAGNSNNISAHNVDEEGGVSAAGGEVREGALSGRVRREVVGNDSNYPMAYSGLGYGSVPIMMGNAPPPVLPPYAAYWMHQHHLHHQQQPPQQQQQQQLQYYQHPHEPLLPSPPHQHPMHPYYYQQYQEQQQPFHQHQSPHHHHHPDLSHLLPPSTESAFTVYSSRWIMLLYMSLLNLLSDWTCYSVAPIALLTMNAFGDVDAESLVTVFLAANAIASALEPAILGRLGLRRTILFGGFLLTLGSIVKSGGLQSTLLMGSSYTSSTSSNSNSNSNSSDGNSNETWRLYSGFFLVGLSQPLYQCTPALLSASWFPENERTMATGVALNSNQLGIGCAFVFGTMLVSSEEDILPYFGLLSLISTITFVGCALQFDDAPPTPPSDTARVIRGDLEIKIPKHWPIIGRFGRSSTVTRGSAIGLDENGGKGGRNTINLAPDAGASSTSAARTESARTESSVIDAIRDWEAKVQEKQAVDKNAPSRATTEESLEGGAMAAISNWQRQQPLFNAAVNAPSPASTDEPVGKEETPLSSNGKKQHNVEGIPFQTPPPHHLMASPDHPLATPSPYYPNPYMMMSPPPSSGSYYEPFPYAHSGMGNSLTTAPSSFYHGYDEQGHYHNALLESTLGYDDFRTRSLVGIENDDEGVEPIMTQVDRQLDIDIRDDQLIQQFKACFRRKGFSHCVVAFTTSGIIINTLSTYMDYLVTLNGAGREYVGIVGGTFQILIMCSSLVFGGWTDASRKYYFITLGMLIFGAFALAVCNVDLDSNAGGDLRWNLLTVAVLAGPLQPISTELGVEVVYPLSENTVLVIQQLFSNLLSAAFIPIFKALRDVGRSPDASEIENIATSQLPQYTFSFYMLIIISAVATCYFATFNGTYLRYEAEEARKAEKESEREKLLSELQKQHGYGSAPVQ